MKPFLSMGRLLGLLTFSSFSYFSHAQKSPQQLQEQRERLTAHERVRSFEVSEERQTPALIRLRQGYAPAEARTALQGLLNTRAGIDELKPVREVAVSNTVQVLEFHQYYKGVKVEHSRYTALVKDGRVSLFNGAFYEVPATAAVQPSLQKEAALDNAKRSVNAKKYAWDEAQKVYSNTKDLGARAALLIELQDYMPAGELVMVKNFTKKGVPEMRLAYKFNIYAVEPLSRAWVYVDAANGKILLRDEIIKHAGNPGPLASSVSTTVPTRYAGTRTIKTKLISGNDPNTGLPLVASNPTEAYVPGSATYGLIDDTKGNGIETYDLNGVGGLPLSLAAAYSQGKSFTDKDNNWTVAEHRRGGAAESENDDIAFDAHWGASVVYDYWKGKHNRLSFDGKDAKIKSFIHSGVGYDNAFWNGSVMTYGDGSYPAPGGFRPLTSLDVCGHEIGHGICSFTSDLVYARESGAMNEGYSDIWAACVEYFAIKKVDPSLGSVYKPFYIGEQISSNPARPLRRMDDPKAEGNPDTYGGANWSDPNCTPTLANDQCGVHNNSGVLNKWFYLLTVGSKAGSGPDAAFAGTDDGVNDKGQVYSVTGLGFDVSEKVAYLTELLLTSTATFAEARAVSIAVATDLSGNACSPMVESVTNAWYAVGVGGQFVKPCTVTYGFVNRNDMAVNEASVPAGCSSQKTISLPVILPPNSSASVTTTGSAFVVQDFSFTPGSFRNTTTQNAKYNIIVTIANDAVIEKEETIAFKIRMDNTGANPIDSILTVTILDDDVVPAIGSGEKVLINETFTRANGFTDPAGWSEKLELPETSGDPLATGKNQWGIFDNKLSITGKEGLTNTVLPNGTYNNASESRTIIRTPLIDARGLSLVNMKFDYTVQGEIDPAGTDPENFPVFDYMAIAYSIDGVNFLELNTDGFGPFASAEPKTGTFSGTLPAFLGNKQFYLAFRWFNDANAGGPVSVQIDNLLVNGTPRKIENQLGHSGSEKLNPYNSDVYFYSTQDGEVIANVKNNSNKGLNCTGASIEKAGNSVFTLYSGTDGQHKVSDKVVRLNPATNEAVSLTVTLFYTEEQLKALETATGKSRTTFGLYRVNATGYTAATATNTKRYAATYTAISGGGGSYRISFTDFLAGSYALGVAVPATATQAMSAELAEAGPRGSWQFRPVYPNPGVDQFNLLVTAPERGKVQVEVVNMYGQLVHNQTVQLLPGTTSIKLGLRKLAGGSYMVRVRDENGTSIHTQQLMKN